EKGKTFEDYTSLSNLSSLSGRFIGFAIADYDRDGRVDIYLYRAGQPDGKDSWLDGKTGKQEGNVLLRNLGNWQFEDVTEASGTAGGNPSTFSAPRPDANNNGWSCRLLPS